MNNYEIIPTSRLDQILAQRADAIEKIQSAAQAIRAAEASVELAAAGRTHCHGRLQCGSIKVDWRFDKADIEILTEELDRGIWLRIFNECGFIGLMDAPTVRKFEEDLKGKPPALTKENVIATVENLRANAGSIARRGIVATFRELSRKYRSNNAFRIGQKVIIQRATAAWRSVEPLVDVDRAFRIADGKAPVENPAADPTTLLGALDATRHKSVEFETEYFACFIYGNGNLHVRFKRPDLVDKINRWIAEECGAVLGNNRRNKRSA